MEVLKEELITFETAKLAKEKGFINGTRGCFIEYKKDYINPRDDNNSKKGDFEYCKKTFLRNGEEESDEDYEYIERPTQSLLKKWLIQVHNINVWVSSKTLSNGKTVFIPHGRTLPDTIKDNLVVDIIEYSTHNSDEAAFEVGLREALKLIKH